MSRKYRDYTDQDIIDKAKEVYSISGLLKALGLKEAGGNYVNLKRNLQRLNVDTSHWTCQGWSKGQQLKDWSDYSKVANMKVHLLKKKGLNCECCGLNSWLGEEIKLEVHHLDSDRTNNSFENLQLLCPNCHSLTDSWRKPKFDTAP